MKTKAMIISVGGTPAPIIHSLNKTKPEFICFFVSKETKKMIDEILQNINFKPRHYDWIVTPNAELLSECYFQLVKRLPDLLEKWEVSQKDICVDYTGGTKTMSVALTLATIDHSFCYSYVGGDERSKGGVGIVIDGKEKMWFLDNPWDVIAQKERKEVSILFNKARYGSAAEILNKCMDRVSKDQKPFLKALHNMITGYDLWDRFKHSQAKIYLYKSRDVLNALGGERREIGDLVKYLEGNIDFLEQLLVNKKPSIYYFQDLMANAKRRANLEKKYDDAVARLYRAIEVLAQITLKERYDIDTSNVKEKEIPEELAEEFISKYKDPKDQKIKIPLYASYQLLCGKGDPLAQEFFERYDKELRSVLDVRNHSILAHGFNPVDQDVFEKMFEFILRFSGTQEKQLPEFPILRI